MTVYCERTVNVEKVIGFIKATTADIPYVLTSGRLNNWIDIIKGLPTESVGRFVKLSDVIDLLNSKVKRTSIVLGHAEIKGLIEEILHLKRVCGKDAEGRESRDEKVDALPDHLHRTGG